MPDKAQPGWTIGSCSGPIVLRKHAADDVLIDVDAKGTCNLLGDAGTASSGIAALEFNDRVDEFLRWAFWAGPSMTSEEKNHRYLHLLSASWNRNKVLGFRTTATLRSRLAGTNSDARPKTKRSNEFRF